jgi:hypothetical protein
MVVPLPIHDIADVALEIKPFHFYHDEVDRHLDATHMLLCWLRECRLTEGFIFRRFQAGDRISMENKPLVYRRSQRWVFQHHLIIRLKSILGNTSTII